MVGAGRDKLQGAVKPGSRGAAGAAGHEDETDDSPAVFDQDLG